MVGLLSTQPLNYSLLGSRLSSAKASQGLLLRALEALRRVGRSSGISLARGAPWGAQKYI